MLLLWANVGPRLPACIELGADKGVSTAELSNLPALTYCRVMVAAETSASEQNSNRIDPLCV